VEKRMIAGMTRVRKKDATTVCEKCGAAMVIAKIEPSPDEPDVERHQFRCEICGAAEWFRFEVPRRE
jgi:predicted RNA-binding Zn-ribbon protein involved in translation (DUF1610 family)